MHITEKSRNWNAGKDQEAVVKASARCGGIMHDAEIQRDGTGEVLCVFKMLECNPTERVLDGVDEGHIGSIGFQELIILVRAEGERARGGASPISAVRQATPPRLCDKVKNKSVTARTGIVIGEVPSLSNRGGVGAEGAQSLVATGLRHHASDVVEDRRVIENLSLPNGRAPILSEGGVGGWQWEPGPTSPRGCTTTPVMS